ncbi:MAG: type II secretion system protein [Kofleriaceae bacterium]
MKARTSQGGFSILEITITLAVVGALTKVALPHFLSTSRKAQNESEVSPMFAELHVRQSQFLSENGSFKALGATEAVSYPTARTHAAPSSPACRRPGSRCGSGRPSRSPAVPTR